MTGSPSSWMAVVVAPSVLGDRMDRNRAWVDWRRAALHAVRHHQL